MASIKAANLGGVLRRLPAFGTQIGMALDAELISYSGQGLVVTAMLSVTGDTVRGEHFACLMHQTRVTCGARRRCWYAPGISVALRAVMSNEVVCRCHLPWGQDSRSAPYGLPQRYLAKQQQNDHPTYDQPESPPRQTLLREETVSKSVMGQIRHGRCVLRDLLGVLARNINAERASVRWHTHAQVKVTYVDDVAIGKRLHPHRPMVHIRATSTL